MTQFKPYNGPERRVHKVFITHNTEYHVRRGICVAVKPRRSQPWNMVHGALQMRLDGIVQNGLLCLIEGNNVFGSRLYFSNGDKEVLTSPVVEVSRPPKNLVVEYPPDLKTAPETAPETEYETAPEVAVHRRASNIAEPCRSH